MKKNIVLSVSLLCLLSLFSDKGIAQTIYQLPNPGFEQWDGNSTSEPTNWNTFSSSDGSYASLASSNHHYRRNGGRPGSDGTYYLTLYTKSIIGVKANGNMTTGRVHAGAMSASSSDNYNYTQRSNSNHCQPWTSTPDSLYVWVSFYASSSNSVASVEAILHGNRDFKAPNDCSNTSYYTAKAKANTNRTTSSSSQMQWQLLRVPFVYDGTADPAYMLINITTNNTPGGGDANDSISIDDILFVYSAWLTGIEVNGEAIADFEKIQYEYTVRVEDTTFFSTETIQTTTEVADATVSKEMVRDNDTTATITITCLAEDGVTSKVYTVHLITSITEDEPVGIDHVATDDNKLVVFPNPANNQISFHATGLALLTDAKGKTVKQWLCDGDTVIPTNDIPAGLYMLQIKGIKTKIVINH